VALNTINKSNQIKSYWCGFISFTEEHKTSGQSFPVVVLLISIITGIVYVVFVILTIFTDRTCKCLNVSHKFYQN